MNITTTLPLSEWTIVSWLMILYLIFTVYRLGKSLDRLEKTVLQEQQDAIGRRRAETIVRLREETIQRLREDLCEDEDEPSGG